MSLEVGDGISTTAKFRDKNGVLVNPSIVKFAFRRPGDPADTVWVYGTDVQVVRDSTGIYHVDLPFDKSSEWVCRWSGSGSGFSRVKYFRVRVKEATLSAPP